MKLLKEILQKTPSKMQEVQPYNPEATSDASKNFLKKHTVQKTEDANKNGDEVFNASQIKTYDRNISNHGYDQEKSKAVYEAKSHKPLSKLQKEKIAGKGKAINPDNDPNEIDAEDLKALRMQKEETLEESGEEGGPDAEEYFENAMGRLKDLKGHPSADVKHHSRMANAHLRKKNWNDADDHIMAAEKAARDYDKKHDKTKKESVDFKSILTDISNKTKELIKLEETANIETWNKIQEFVYSEYEKLVSEMENMKQQEKKSIMEKAPPGAKAESFIMKNKSSFKKRYGDRWEKVLYATAHKIFGKGK